MTLINLAHFAFASATALLLLMRSGESTGRVGENSEDIGEGVRGRQEGTKGKWKMVEKGGSTMAMVMRMPYAGDRFSASLCTCCARRHRLPRRCMCICVYVRVYATVSRFCILIALSYSHQVEHHRPPPSHGATCATGSCSTLGDNFKLVNPLWRTWIRMYEELSAGPGA